MTTLRLFVNQASDSVHEWQLFDNNNVVLKHNKDSLANLPMADETEVIIPSDWVSFVPATLPSGNQKKILEALPYLIEDHLVTPPEQVHVVIIGAQERAHVTLASISKEVLASLIHDLQRHGVTPDRVLPATLLPPLDSESWAVVWEDAHFFLRTSLNSGVALTNEDNDTMPIELQLALQHAMSVQHLPSKIIIYGDNSLALSNWTAIYGVQFERSHTEWKNVPPPKDFNLLQGAFAPKSKQWEAIGHAKPALLMLAAMALLALLGSSIDWGVKIHQKNKIEEQMTALFLSAFPEAKNVVDAPLQMQRKLNELQHASGDIQGNDFLPLLANVTKHTGGLSNVIAMHYQNEQLRITLQTPNQAAAQVLAEKMNLPGYSAVVENMKTSEQVVTLDVVFKAEEK